MSRIRVREEERQLLKDLQKIPEVREMAVEEGIIDDADSDPLSYDKLFQLIIPDDAEILSRPEDEMAWVTVDDIIKDEVQELAGENISAHRVVREYTQQFVEDNDIEIETNGNNDE